MAGPFRLLPAGIYRVRPLRPVRTLPAGSGAPDVVLTRLQSFFLASAPLPLGRHQLLAGRWPCVTGLTSYLSGCFRFCSRVITFCVTAPVRRFHGLCQVRSLPAVASPLRAPLVLRVGPFGGVGPPGSATAFWSAQ